jgi:uncharacterized protein
MNAVRQEEILGTLTEDMRRVVEEQRLGFAATVCPDGTPNLSPKGTTAVWDDRLTFADIRSPRTMANLRHNPAIEVNVVDPILRKGYRFKGTATVLSEGGVFEEILKFYRERGLSNEVRAVVLVEVGRAAAHVPGLRPRPYRSGGARTVGAPPRGSRSRQGRSRQVSDAVRSHSFEKS